VSPVADRSAGGNVQPVTQPQQSRLPRTRGTRNHGDPRRRDLKIHRPQNPPPPALNHHTIKNQQRLNHTAHSPRHPRHALGAAPHRIVDRAYAQGHDGWCFATSPSPVGAVCIDSRWGPRARDVGRDESVSLGCTPTRRQDGQLRTVSGQRVAYTRVSTLDQNTARELDGLAVDRTFTDSASGKDVNRPQLAAMLGFVREGDTVIVHSMDRLARNLDDLRRIVRELTSEGVHVQLVKEQLTFTGEDTAMANLLASVVGAFTEFEGALIGERQREGITLAKQRGA
jgi:predicted site-specific integrase-resolvase